MDSVSSISHQMPSDSASGSDVGHNPALDHNYCDHHDDTQDHSHEGNIKNSYKHNYDLILKNIIKKYIDGLIHKQLNFY